MTITLDLQKSAGIKLDLTKAAPGLKRLRAFISWNMHPSYKDSPAENRKKGFDLDLAVYALNKDGKIDSAGDVIFFNNKRYVDDSIVLPFDNTEGDDEKDDPSVRKGEEIIFNLDKVPADRTQLDLFVFLFEYIQRHQNLGMIANATFELFNMDTDEVIQAYKLNESYAADSAVHLVTLTREGSGWVLTPIGKGASADEEDVVQAYV